MSASSPAQQWLHYTLMQPGGETGGVIRIRETDLDSFFMNVIVNKQVWMHCFGNEIPSAKELVRQIDKLEKQLTRMGAPASPGEEKVCKRIWNSLNRNQKMLAAVRDGQPWAWYQYPSIEEYATRH